MCKVLFISKDEGLQKTIEAELLVQETKNNHFEYFTEINILEAFQLVSSEQSHKAFDVVIIDLNTIAQEHNSPDILDFHCIDNRIDLIVVNCKKTGSKKHPTLIGSIRYFQEPFNMDDVTKSLVEMKNWRIVRRQRNCLQEMNNIFEQAEEANKFDEVAKYITKGVLKLGFRRSRLYWLPHVNQAGSNEERIVGIWADGVNAPLDKFEKTSFSLNESPYLKKTKTIGRTVVFNGRELGPGAIGKLFNEKDYPPPVGQWACLPLFEGKRFSGALVLDFDREPRSLDDFQYDLLELFSHQASVMLARVRLFGEENHSRNIIKTINEVGQYINEKAARLDSYQLFEAIYQKINDLLHVDNFYIALINEDSHKIDFRLVYEMGIWKQKNPLQLGEGMVGHLINTNKSLYLSFGDEQYRIENNIKMIEKPAKCWGGVPLIVEGKTIGAIIIQDMEYNEAFCKEDVDLLQAIANHIAGVVRESDEADKQKENLARLALLNRASADLFTLAEQNFDFLWHALLTIITANYGLRYHRAWLFLWDKSVSALKGVTAIGNIDQEMERLQWEIDENTGMNFDKYLENLSQNLILPTPLGVITKDYSIDLIKFPNLEELLKAGIHQVIHNEIIGSFFPESFIKSCDLYDCAIVPLKTTQKILGVVVVDYHKRKAVVEKDLSNLEAFTNIASLVYENISANRARDALLDVNREIIKQNQYPESNLSLILNKICETVRIIMKADLVVLYPNKIGGDNYIYDVENCGIAGETKLKAIKDKPRQKGVAAYISRTDILIVPDVSADNTIIEGERLADHQFIKRENIQAFIGIPIRDMGSGTNLGVLFIDYYQKRSFSEFDYIDARSFSDLAANAIHNEYVTLHGIESQQELKILQRLLEQSLGYSSKEEFVTSLLSCAQELIHQPASKPVLYLPSWYIRGYKDAPQKIYESYELSDNKSLVKNQVIPFVPLEIDRVLETQTSFWSDNENNIYIKVCLGETPLGVLHIRNIKRAKSQDIFASLERLGSAAANGLDNIIRREHLEKLLNCARSVTMPIDLDETFEKILENLRFIAPDIDGLTLWYLDPIENKVKLAHYFGVTEETEMKAEEPLAPSLVWKVMKSAEPIWAPVAKGSPLDNVFVTREGIVSSVAFPLRANQNKVGAMFLNYRKPHRFTFNEQLLFPIMAEIAAANIQSSSLLTANQQEAKRLQATLSVAEAGALKLDIEEVVHTVLEQLCSLLPKAQACVFTYNEEDEQMEWTRSSNQYFHIDNPKFVNKKIFSISEEVPFCGIAREALSSNDPLNVHCNCDRLKKSSLLQEAGSELCKPLISSQNKLLGMLIVSRPVSECFDKADCDLIFGISSSLSLAMERIRNDEELDFNRIVANAFAQAGDMAHDIKREVGSIRQYAYSIQQEKNNPVQIFRYARAIDDCAELLSSYVHWGDTLEKTFNLEQELSRHIDEIAEKTEGIELKMDLNSPGVEIKGSPDSLKRALRHLIKNSSKAMDNNGSIIIKTFNQVGKTIEIQVEDTGPGINEEIRPFLFKKPINREGKDAKESGNGLMLVRQAIEGELKGKVHALPQQAGRGTVISIKLPVFEEKP